MDKFVVRTPRSLGSSPSTSNKKSKGKQLTLAALPGVVSIEDIQRKKTRLESETCSSEEKIKILKELLCKQPSTAILVETGIGKTVRRLKKSEVEGVRSAAELCFNKWRALLERRVELSANKLEVRSDKETERLRGSSRKFLLAALPPSSSPSLAERIEKEIFRVSSKLVNNKYRRLSRKVVFALKSGEHGSSLGERDIQDLVAKYNK